MKKFLRPTLMPYLNGQPHRLFELEALVEELPLHLRPVAKGLYTCNGRKRDIRPKGQQAAEGIRKFSHQQIILASEHPDAPNPFVDWYS